MINLILIIQIIICSVLSLICWLVLLSVPKIQNALNQAELAEKELSQKVELARKFAGKASLNYLLREIILTPASLFILLEIMALSRTQKLSKTLILKTILAKK